LLYTWSRDGGAFLLIEPMAENKFTVREMLLEDIEHRPITGQIPS
jgi:hypothetical protein